MDQYRYLDEAGEFSYDYYKRVQIAGNIAKLKNQWVDEATIEFLAGVVRRMAPSPRFGICHGTRRGNEQAWFRRHLAQCEVIGTEISDTAETFAFTVKWDFHEPNPAWVEKADFIYSNSWDHSYDPQKMFKVWLEQLSPGGVLLLEHTAKHVGASELDPFGASVEELIAVLSGIDPTKYHSRSTIDDAPGVRVNNKPPTPVRYIVMQRA